MTEPLFYEGTEWASPVWYPGVEYFLAASALPCVECHTLTHRVEVNWGAVLCSAGCYKSYDAKMISALLDEDLGPQDQGGDDDWS